MKICIFTEEFLPYPGGVARYVDGIAVAASELGHDVTVYVIGTRSGKDLYKSRKYKVNQIIDKPFSLFYWFKVSFNIRKILKNDFDVAVYADYKSLICSLFVSHDIRKISVVHGTEVRGRLLKFFSVLRIRPFISCDKIIANSNFTRNEALKNHSYIDPYKIKTCYLGGPEIKDIEYNESLIRESIKDELSEGRYSLLSVGRIEPRKGIDVVLKALKEIKDDIELTYNIIGKVIDEKYYKELNSLSSILSKNIRINFFGQVSEDELNYLYKKSDLFVHTSVAGQVAVEGFGLVLLEASAKGLPILASKVDAIPEVICEYKTGLLVDPKKIDEVKEKLMIFINGEKWVEDIELQSKEYVRKFTWKKHVIEALND